MGFDPSDSHASLTSAIIQPIEPDYDVQLLEFVDTISFDKDVEISDQIETIAQLVSDRFGGQSKSIDQLRAEYLVSIEELKKRKNSNVLFLGQAKIGLYRERALCFKLAMDYHSIPTTLQRSQTGFGRAWNTVRLGNQEYVVDLVHSPGKLLSGVEAYKYISF